MKALGFARSLAALLGLVALGGCTERQPAQELRSLSGSEKAVFLCRSDAGEGHPYSDCPDRNTADDDQPESKLSVMALVSQTLTDEVAVVNVTSGRVVDVDPSTPGYGFLRVGGRPVSMAVTPGGKATFVATAEAGRNGIFALPTKFLSAPQGTEDNRDLTTWNACRLPETPGEMALVVGGTGDCLPEDSGSIDLTRRGALLSEEAGGEQARKLLVSFPDSGRIGIIDAQQVLDRAPGSFDPCPVTYVSLSADVPAGVAQTLPPDLVPEATCTEVPAPMPPAPIRGTPRPSGFAQADSRLYIGDAAAPVIHVLDTTDVCNVTELAPLLPMSLREPNRVVTTRRLAVSPLTPSGQQFVYAVDPEDSPHATVMAFDVSPGSTDPTPIVRPGSPETVGEKPDRLTFASAAHDVVFAYRDIPYVNEATGAAEFGVRCDPNPNVTTGPSVLARPNADYTVGARPGLLRGLFGFVLLTNGRVEIVDVDDLDAACRRPVSLNTSSTPDIRGCAGDPELTYDEVGEEKDGEPVTAYVSRTEAPLTTNEESCRIVAPHRPRSARLMLNNSQVGIRSPALRTFPQFSLPPGEVTIVAEDRPRLLAVPFAAPMGARELEQNTALKIGSTLYQSDTTSGGDQLPTNPNDKRSEDLATQNSVVLPPFEPRAYAADFASALVFEGALKAPENRAGFLSDEGVFTDASLSFCGEGVYDPATMAQYAATDLGLSAEDAEAFGASHGDYIQITSAFPAETDSYWSGGRTRAACVTRFGESTAQTLLPSRDLAIVEAFSNKLTVRPREPGVELSELVECFPTALSYRIRAGNQWVLLRGGNLRHDVVASGPDSRCVRSCNPFFRWQKSRVFEVSSRSPNCRPPVDGAAVTPEEARSLRVGCATDADLACVYDQNDAEYQSLIGSPAESCIFNGLTERFAVYRGRSPSVRDAAFRWDTTGGFVPLEMNLTVQSTGVMPQSIQYLSQSEQLAVVDGASQGLSLLSLDTFGVVRPSPFY